MKLLTLCYEFPPIGGGGSKVVYGLTRELVRQGHEVDIVTMGYKGLPREEDVNGVHVYRLPCIRTRKSVCYSPEMATYIAAALPFVLNLTKRNRYDLNHTHFILPDGFIAYILKKRRGLPYVITAHGSDVPGYNPHRFKMMHKFLSPLWRKIIHSAEKIICPSRALQKLIVESGSLAPVEHIPNGLATEDFNPGRPKQKRVLLVSRVLERKGFQFFLEAMDCLDEDYEVNIVGEGPYLPVLKSLAARQTKKVQFLGWMDHAAGGIKELYETSQIFVFPSEAENFPIVLLEAMASGMAIITTGGTGCAEVVGDTGLLIESRNSESIRKALRRLLNEPELCASMGAAARKRFENHFSWATNASLYARLYQSCKATS
jgi:glycosyltransferase involved in cell wall biosynthesis